jgi:hypothetical protein
MTVKSYTCNFFNSYDKLVTVRITPNGLLAINISNIVKGIKKDTLWLYYIEKNKERAQFT